MYELPDWLLRGIADCANLDLRYKHCDQQVIAFPTKVIGDWVVLYRTKPSTGHNWHDEVTLYKANAERGTGALDWICPGSRQLKRAMIVRATAPNFQAIKIGHDHGVEIYIALIPVRAHP